MMLSDRHVQGKEALEIGLIDRFYDGQPRDVALKAAQHVRVGKLETRRTDQIAAKPNHAHLDEVEVQLLQTHSHLFSPHKYVEAVRACSLPIAEGLRVEGQVFRDCMDTPQRAGLIHAFFGERAVCTAPKIKIDPRQVEHIGIIGAGTMGSGIATACLLVGIRVTLIESTQNNLDKGTATIEQNLQGAMKRGKLQAAHQQTTQSPLDTALDIEALGKVDLVIEAAFEDMAVNSPPNPEIDAIIMTEREKAGISVKPFKNKDMVERSMTAMISEAIRVLEEKIAVRPLDVDLVFLFEYGFPRHRGDPLHYADKLGPQELISRIETYAQEDSYYWQVPVMLRQMALDGTKFSDLNK
jgi:preprotein translocase subunit Sec61beta